MICHSLNHLDRSHTSGTAQHRAHLGMVVADGNIQCTPSCSRVDVWVSLGIEENLHDIWITLPLHTSTHNIHRTLFTPLHSPILTVSSPSLCSSRSEPRSVQVGAPLQRGGHMTRTNCHSLQSSTYSSCSVRLIHQGSKAVLRISHIEYLLVIITRVSPRENHAQFFDVALLRALKHSCTQPTHSTRSLAGRTSA